MFNLGSSLENWAIIGVVVSEPDMQFLEVYRSVGPVVHAEGKHLVRNHCAVFPVLEMVLRDCVIVNVGMDLSAVVDIYKEGHIINNNTSCRCSQVKCVVSWHIIFYEHT